ncbi:DNA methyltransferase, partial [Sinorhizobium medicae]
PEKLGATPRETLNHGEDDKNNLPDVRARWKNRNVEEQENPRTAQSFCVPKAEIVATGSYDLSLNRYSEVEHEEHEHDSPKDIIREIRELEAEIANGLSGLEEMLG